MTGTLVYDPDERAFVPLRLAPGPALAPAETARVTLLRRAAAAVPSTYGERNGRHSAPEPQAFDQLAAVYRLELPDWSADPELDAVLLIGWAGDVAQLRIDGRTVTDRFWDGAQWTVNLRDVGHRPGCGVTLHILPLPIGSTVHLPRAARDRLLAADGPLQVVDDVRVIGRVTRREPDRKPR